MTGLSNERIFSFNRVGTRDSYRLDSTTSIQEQKYAVYRTLPVLKSGTVLADCLKCHFLILFSEEMVGLFDFLFVRTSVIFRRETFEKIGY